ncbi:MAG: glycerol-3-phosphate 1-O-acyltransferase PlsY [Candidatus Aminicenantes bacterium]|nr:glycerol-3-phosphate 1-O-acyltransferase PlsY [Candidatus Aminicenantes bacterium]
MSSHEISFLVLSYLLGSIPFGYLVFYFSEGKDIRSQGSGNIGATNVLRSKGKLAGLLTLALDILKGALPVLYGRSHFDLPWFVLLGALAVLLGHVFPVFLKFRGGKGVASLVGVFLVFYFPALLVFLAVFLLVLRLTRFVSLASLLGTTALFFSILFTQVAEVAMVVFAMLLLIVFRHRANIQRLLAGNELKFSLKKNG